MLIITSLAAAAFTAALAAASTTSSLPPLVITIDPAATVPPALLSRVLEEADAVWRPAGVTLIWRRAPPIATSPLERAPADPTGLRVVIGDLRGAVREDRVPLGWIEFDDGSPAQEIYVSYRNAVDFMADAALVVGLRSHMTRLEQEMNLARAMGRALAHELGHYLLASKAHTRGGLMKATHTAFEFFDSGRRPFAVDPAQREVIAARLRHDTVVVRR